MPRRRVPGPTAELSSCAPTWCPAWQRRCRSTGAPQPRWVSSAGVFVLASQVPVAEGEQGDQDISARVLAYGLASAINPARRVCRAGGLGRAKWQRSPPRHRIAHPAGPHATPMPHAERGRRPVRASQRRSSPALPLSARCHAPAPMSDTGRWTRHSCRCCIGGSASSSGLRWLRLAGYLPLAQVPSSPRSGWARPPGPGGGRSFPSQRQRGRCSARSRVTLGTASLAGARTQRAPLRPRAGCANPGSQCPARVGEQLRRERDHCYIASAIVTGLATRTLRVRRADPQS